MSSISPKLRVGDRYNPPYPLNKFPTGFPTRLAAEVVYFLTTRGANAALEGKDWECIFAACISGEWHPSNNGLDDIRKTQTAWGAKTVKSTNPHLQAKVRLISGRNSPAFSFSTENVFSVPTDVVGKMILDIWNARVDAIRAKYNNLRTIVLIKSHSLLDLCIYEKDTFRYDPELFYWEWNANRNLVGYSKRDKEHLFTWQPSGSQFTIIDKVPDQKLLLTIKAPPGLSKEATLDAIGFSPKWVSIVPSP